MRLNEHNELAEKHAPAAARYRAALISVHGMNTRGKWQKELIPDVQDYGVRYMAVDYDHVTLGVLHPEKRLPVIKDILIKYREQRRYASRIAAVAHSFGSLALMQGIAERTRLRFQRIILYGCIVHPKYPWQRLYDEGRIQRVLHETSKKDFLPMIAPIFIPDSGASGRNGFEKCPPFVKECENPSAGHSGLQYRDHYRDVWLPFVVSDLDE